MSKAVATRKRWEFFCREQFWHSVCHVAIKVFRSILQLQCASAQPFITLLDDSHLNAFQTFCPRLNILCMVDVPYIIDDCDFRSAD